MKIDFADMKDQLNMLDKEVENVIREYNGAKWEDEVKTSHASFISQCNDIGSVTNHIKSELEEVEQLSGSVDDSVNVKQELGNIKSQADSIVV